MVMRLLTDFSRFFIFNTNFFDAFLKPSGLNFGAMLVTFSVKQNRENTVHGEKTWFSRNGRKTIIKLMIFRVVEAQNCDFFGPDGDFWNVRKRSRFLHRFWNEKVTKMIPKWSQNGTQRQYDHWVFRFWAPQASKNEPKRPPRLQKYVFGAILVSFLWFSQFWIHFRDFSPRPAGRPGGMRGCD